MSRESAIVQRLIDALDDAQSWYGKQARRVVSPDLRDWLERTAGTHWVIADELGDEMIATGSNATRRGSRLGSLRTLFTERLARSNSNVDMAYASHAARWEAAILRGVRDTAKFVRDTVLRDRLKAHDREIERASTQICCLLSTMQLRADPRAARAGVIVHVSARASARPSALRVRTQASA